jgi:hypothetical protein
VGNTDVAAIVFFCNTIVSCVTGFQPNWAMHQSACDHRNYCLVTFCTVFIYSYQLRFDLLTFISIEQNLVCVAIFISPTLYIITCSFLIRCHVIIFIDIYTCHVRLLTKRIIPIMIMNATPRILVKNHRKELKSIVIQVGIYTFGGMPAMFAMICSPLPVFQMNCIFHQMYMFLYSSLLFQRWCI